MIDIHNHALFGVDDGAGTIQDSVAMLQDAQRQGIEAIILTPHYRHGMFAYPMELIKTNFLELNRKAENIGIRLYLGCEYHVNSRIIDYLESERCLTLASSNYVLTEYEFDTEYAYIQKRTGELILAGYLPVIAHIERYDCFRKDPQLCEELSDGGAFIQVNADSILGLEGRKTEHFCRTLLKQRWVDIVASDSHGVAKRANHMKKCQRHICKKYGVGYAQKIFEQNPEAIIKNRIINK